MTEGLTGGLRLSLNTQAVYLRPNGSVKQSVASAPSRPRRSPVGCHRRSQGAARSRLNQ